jgi:hypothetical protein
VPQPARATKPRPGRGGAAHALAAQHRADVGGRLQVQPSSSTATRREIRGFSGTPAVLLSSWSVCPAALRRCDDHRRPREPVGARPGRAARIGRCEAVGGPVPGPTGNTVRRENRHTSHASETHSSPFSHSRSPRVPVAPRTHRRVRPLPRRQLPRGRLPRRRRPTPRRHHYRCPLIRRTLRSARRTSTTLTCIAAFSSSRPRSGISTGIRSRPFDWRVVRETLVNVDQHDLAGGHVRGVLHWRTAHRLEFSVPGTNLKATYEPTTGAMLCI